MVHIAQVVRAGWNNFRSMVTGYELVPATQEVLRDASPPAPAGQPAPASPIAP